MGDVHDTATRSRNMAAIKSRNTKPELLIRSGLHRRGFRYLLHKNGLPGKPDLVFPRYKAVVLINGCFWHWHDCHLFRWPGTRQEFWRCKIQRNAANDMQNIERLRQLGWRIAVVWECALKGKTRSPVGQSVEALAEWLKSDAVSLNIRGSDDSNT